ncbi:MAG: hypothetical protein GF398_12405 [Chitinivibrionales bacterium]|nr:hypothetical protein [Chitinivibrionales bacterium]
MAATSLELYKKAYELQYQQQRPAEAIIIYRDLQNSNPLSHEAAFAELQLASLRQRGNAAKNFTARKINVFIQWASVILLLIFTGVLGIGEFLVFRETGIDVSVLDQQVHKIGKDVAHIQPQAN